MIELVMVLLIVGILAYFVMPKLSTSTFSQKGLNDKMVSSLEYARKYGVATRRYVCVRTASNAVTFTIISTVPESLSTTTCPASQSGSEQAIQLPVSDSNCGGAVNQICAPSGYTLTSTAATLTFDDAGGNMTTSAGTTVQYTVGGPGTSTVVAVEGLTGYVH